MPSPGPVATLASMFIFSLWQRRGEPHTPGQDAASVDLGQEAAGLRLTQRCGGRQIPAPICGATHARGPGWRRRHASDARGLPEICRPITMPIPLVVFPSCLVLPPPSGKTSSEACSGELKMQCKRRAISRPRVRTMASLQEVQMHSFLHPEGEERGGRVDPSGHFPLAWNVTDGALCKGSRWRARAEQGRTLLSCLPITSPTGLMQASPDGGEEEEGW